MFTLSLLSILSHTAKQVLRLQHRFSDVSRSASQQVRVAAVAIYLCLDAPVTNKVITVLAWSLSLRMYVCVYTRFVGLHQHTSINHVPRVSVQAAQQAPNDDEMDDSSDSEEEGKEGQGQMRASTAAVAAIGDSACLCVWRAYVLHPPCMSSCPHSIIQSAH